MKGIQSYKTVRTETADQTDLVIMAFEAALRHQTLALDAARKGDRMEVIRLAGKARALFCELLGALDHEAAPELCARLGRLYGWVITELGHAHQDDGQRRLHTTIRVTRNLLDGWNTAFRKAA